jgi:ADP-heptose:LPS heptosyltransferase/predicted SAM-dependent methyltransferase
MVWRAEDPQGNEAGKVKYDIVRYTRGRGLDLGCGSSKAFPHFIGIDDGKDTALFGIPVTPDIVGDCMDLAMFADDSLDFVFSSHLLEHVQDFEAALREWWRVIKEGGHLVLYLPHRDLYPRIGQAGANPDHKHDFDNADIVDAMTRIVMAEHAVAPAPELGAFGFDLLVDELRGGDREYSFLQVYRKTRGISCRFSCEMPKPTKTVCVVRYGGFGDMLQASAILPELQRQGYHITMMTTPKGQDVLREDPHIDEWFIQDPNQVPNVELHPFWDRVAQQFQRFINLSESIEGTLLAVPGRANHGWPHSVRHRNLNRNYAEWTADLADVSFVPEGQFYPSKAERHAAERYLDAIGFANKFVIVFALAGSSRHKFYPWQDEMIQMVLDACPDARFVLTGDDACRLLESGWESNDRVALESGAMPIRSVLTLAQHADLVLGPETGVLNAVAYEAGVRKVVLLSHSSEENLTKHWLNTSAIYSTTTPCYPCHRMHYTDEFCPQDERTGAALCQVAITPDRVAKPIVEAYLLWAARQIREEAA